MQEQHGMCNTRLYSIWESMKTRCANPNHKSYVDYGGRGISVCETWGNSFTAFMEWAVENGYQDDLTLDRIDNGKGYSPENCKWSTAVEQARNRRTSTVITFNGRSCVLEEWAEMTGVSSRTISRRVKAGWVVEDALFLPERRIKRNRCTVAHNARPVIRLNDGAIFDTTFEAAQAVGIDNSSVVKVCKGKRGSTRGFVFAYWPQQAGKGDAPNE